MKVKLFGMLFFVALFAFEASAQTTFDGRTLDEITNSFNTADAIGRVKIKKITLETLANRSVYKVQSEISDSFKENIKHPGKTKRPQIFTFYTSYSKAETDSGAQQFVGKEWIVFLKKIESFPEGGTGWYEIENSKLSVSEQLLVELRQLKRSWRVNKLLKDDPTHD